MFEGFMDNEYDQITASHYFVFRPFLHSPILERCIGNDQECNVGLDIGCGTGHSSIALANYCDKVFGIDPSSDMLSKAIQHSKVDCRLYNGVELEFENNCFNIITFAGSLYYAKSQHLLDEVVRVSKSRATAVVYDFQVLLDEILESLNVHLTENTGETYNHEENFSGLNTSNLALENTSIETISMIVNSSDLSHLLLSSKNSYCTMSEEYGHIGLHEKVKNHLDLISQEGIHHVEARVYYSIYKRVK